MRLPRQPQPAFTLVELLVVISIITLLAAMLLPVIHESLIGGRRAVCASQQKQLCVATRGYLTTNADFFPPAWHKSGGAIDLGDVSFFRFLIYEYADAGFRHVVRGNASAPQAAAEKYRLTRAFWHDPARGWTREYFAPFVVFRGHRDSTGGLDAANRAPFDKHAQWSELVRGVPATERPLFAGVNASYPSPESEDPNDPAHEAEMRSGWTRQLVTDCGVQVFIGAGRCLRADGNLATSRFDFRHGDVANVAFLDGHVDPLRRSDKAQLERIVRLWNHMTRDP